MLHTTPTNELVVYQLDTIFKIFILFSNQIKIYKQYKTYDGLVTAKYSLNHARVPVTDEEVQPSWDSANMYCPFLFII